MTIFCHPSHPVPPAWILRSRRSMQNVAWPGREAVPLSTKEPIVLRYRLLIHPQPLEKAALEREWQAYSAEN